MHELADRIAATITPSLNAMGFELVRVRVDGKRQARVEIMAERHNRKPMGVVECTEISRAVSALLDVEDPIAGAYTLEVTSPGIDRPLLRPEDYRRFAGQTAKVELRFPDDGRRRFTGTIVEADDATVRLDLGQGEIRPLKFADIERAKLVLTDRLIAATRPTPISGTQGER